MDFYVYDVTMLNDYIEMDDSNEVESGLSLGELQQSLTDRFREEIKTGNPVLINENLKRLGFDTTAEDMEDNPNAVLEDIKETLYDYEDEELEGEWKFTSEVIYVKMQ